MAKDSGQRALSLLVGRCAVLAYGGAQYHKSHADIDGRVSEIENPRETELRRIKEIDYGTMDQAV